MVEQVTDRNTFVESQLRNIFGNRIIILQLALFVQLYNAHSGKLFGYRGQLKNAFRIQFSASTFLGDTVALAEQYFAFICDQHISIKNIFLMSSR
ncbi:hypothetical protein D3C80_1923440 [compost metagenome]